MNIERKADWLTRALRIVVSMACLAGLAVKAEAQFYAAVAAPATNSNTITKTLEGASLQTITDQELFKLRRAKEFAEEGDAISAIALWQSVLDRAGSQLMTRDEWKYSSTRHEYPKFVTVANEIESILSALPEDALELYRIKADGEARAILANRGGRSRTEVLSEVVRRFFVSSLGDDAAFELACIRLDRFEFTDASRLLRKCLNDHPDCSIARDELLLRLAVADGRIGDLEAAENALSTVTTSGDPRIAMVRKDFTDGNANSLRLASQTSGDWLMKHGTPDRTAMMPTVPESAFPSEVSELWSYNFDVHAKPLPFNPNQIYGGMYGGAYGAVYVSGFYVDSSITFGGVSPTLINGKKPGSTKSDNRIDRRLLVDQWKQGGWSPAGGLLFYDGRVYFKSENRIVCCSADSGEMVWKGIENAFEIDPATRQQNSMMVAMTPQNSEMRKPEEVQLFGDQVYQAMSIVDGILYSIEGPSELDEAPPQPQQQPHPYGFNMTVPSRARRNWLTAYDARSGKLRWRRGAREEEVEGSKFDVGFACAPISGAGLVYATVNDAGSLWLAALDPSDGTTAWRTFLCDEPAGSCNPWAATGIAYADGDVYVATGAGIVASIDGVSGAMRWVVRYERSGDARQMPNPYGMQMQVSKPSGWRDDVVVATGRAIIVMGSDSDEIFALHRRTGEVLWDSPRKSKGKAEYYLGTSGNRLYVGAKNVVRCYDTIGGRVIWETPVEDSSGTGIVTRDAIYIPAKSSIVKLSSEDGSPLARASFATMTREPVGNLYSDGDRLFGVGVARAYALTDLRERLSSLDERAAEADIQATLERARFRSYQGNLSATWEDLNIAYEMLTKSETATERSYELASDELKGKKYTAVELASDVVLQVLNELGLPRSTPKETLEYLVRMRSDLLNEEATAVQKNLMLRSDGVLDQSLASIHFNQKKGLTREILTVAQLCDQPYLCRSAQRAMSTTSSIDDLGILQDALLRPHSSTQAIVAAGLAGLGEEGSSLLQSYLQQDIPDLLRFEIAIALVNAEDSNGLTQLGQLLESKSKELQRDAMAALVKITERDADQELSLKQIKDWQQWIASNGDASKWVLPYVHTPAPRGRTLVCYLNGLIEEFDGEGKSKWKISVKGPNSASGLSNGHRLVASTQQKNVTEYDADGKRVWSIRVDGQPTRAERLENGNTLVATMQPGKVYEYRPDGSVAWSYASSSGVIDARRMVTGNTLITLQDGRIIQVSPSGDLVWNLSGLSRPVSAQPLHNGNILVAIAGSNQITEYDSDKSIVWNRGGINGVLDAMRLPDGNTLVAEQLGVRLYSPAGKLLKSNVPNRNNGSTNRLRVSGSYLEAPNGQQMANRVYRY